MPPPSATREVGFELRLIARLAARRPRRRAPHAPGCATAGRRCARTAAGRQYATFLSDEGRPACAAAYGDRLARLVALKDRYDPTNVFRFNVNIPPSGGGIR